MMAGVLKYAVGVAVIACLIYFLIGYLSTDRVDFDEDVLQGKNIIVTGASSGIGEQMAYWYARFGANVFITARREDRLKKVVENCQKLGLKSSKFGYVAADMAIKSDRERVIQEAAAFLGAIDQLILNHALMSKMHKWEGTNDQLDHIENLINVNFLSFVHLTALALPALTRSNGSIMAVGSTLARLPTPYILEYSSAKFAMDGFFSGLRHEFKANSRNVSVTFGIIGIVETDAAVDSLGRFLPLVRNPEKLVDSEVKIPTAQEGAYAIISATTRRVAELYYPANQWPWLRCVRRILLPTYSENLDIF